MKTISINFGTWDKAAKGGRLRRIYTRISINRHKWTPFVIVQYRLLYRENCLAGFDPWDDDHVRD